MACSLTASGGRPCIIKCLVAWSNLVFSPQAHGIMALRQAGRGRGGSPCPHPAFSLVAPTIHPSITPSWSTLTPPQRASLLEDIIQPHVPSLISFCCFEAPGLAFFLDWEPLEGRSLVFCSLHISTAADATSGLPVPSQLRPLGPEIRVPVFRSLPRAHWAPALVPTPLYVGNRWG